MRPSSVGELVAYRQAIPPGNKRTTHDVQPFSEVSLEMAGKVNGTSFSSLLTALATAAPLHSTTETGPARFLPLGRNCLGSFVFN
jgi:hypothetical protein